MDVLEQLSAFTSRLILRQQRQPQGFLPRLKRSSSYLTLNKLIAYAVPFAGRVGFEVTELKPGLLKARIPHKVNSDHSGFIYSGALFTLADMPSMVMSICEFGTSFRPALKELNLRVQTAATSDVTVEFKIPKRQIKEILAQATKDGVSEFKLHGRLFGSEGELIAETTGVYELRYKAS